MKLLKNEEEKKQEKIKKSGNKLKKELEKIRKNIPEKYNQVELLDQLYNNKIDLLFSITTRTDGKTFNYLYALAKLSLKFDFTTIIIVRHMELRGAMLAQIRDVYSTMDDLNEGDLYPAINSEYVEVNYKEQTPFIILDLNNANDLKNYSSVLKKANIILYDEFLAVGGQYTDHEFLKFKTIFETMDRGYNDNMNYTNGRRKAIFLGNPVDFGSEFLAYWKLYEYLELQPMNTIKCYNNIAIERRRNQVAQENKNNRIFNNGENESITGTFKINNWAIKQPKTNDKRIIIKTLEKYLVINLEKIPVLEITQNEENYKYNTDLVDNSKNSTYLKASYYNENFPKKYIRGEYRFANQYSKDYILQNYPTLKINKIIKENIAITPSFKEQEKEIDEENLKLLKQRLFMQYFG